MKEAFGKPTRMFAIAIAVGFYTTFVLQSLWNWFAVPALHLEPISYWSMYGLQMLFSLITQKDETVKEQQWERLFKVIGLCVPESQHDAVAEILQAQTDNVWFQLGMMAFFKVLGNTTALTMGWAIHTFLI